MRAFGGDADGGDCLANRCPARARPQSARESLRRLDAAERVANLDGARWGDYDNAFDGAVTAVYHILDAFELARHGRTRSSGEADAPTALTDAVDALAADGVRTPSVRELTGLNAERNTSVHGGEPLSPFDADRVLEAVDTARYFLGAVSQYLAAAGLAT